VPLLPELRTFRCSSALPDPLGAKSSSKTVDGWLPALRSAVVLDEKCPDPQCQKMVSMGDLMAEFAGRHRGERRGGGKFLAPLCPSSSPGLTGRSSIPEAAVLEPRSRGVLDAPHARSMTAEGGVSSRSRGAWRPSFSISPPSSKTEGAGKAGCGLHPWSACIKKHAAEPQVQPEQPAFPAQWF
jgi:hypothetical protein